MENIQCLVNILQSSFFADFLVGLDLVADFELVETVKHETALAALAHLINIFLAYLEAHQLACPCVSVIQRMSV